MSSVSPSLCWPLFLFLLAFHAARKLGFPLIPRRFVQLSTSFSTTPKTVKRWGIADIWWMEPHSTALLLSIGYNKSLLADRWPLPAVNPEIPCPSPKSLLIISFSILFWLLPSWTRFFSSNYHNLPRSFSIHAAGKPYQAPIPKSQISASQSFVHQNGHWKPFLLPFIQQPTPFHL